jgi:predicted glycosyltransferase
MINHSFLYDHNDEPTTTDMPVSRRSQQTNRTTSDGKQDYVLIDQDPLGTAKQIERILNYYRQELKQESTTQLNCNQKLVTRLIDFIRPAYSSHKQKMNDLDTLYEDISTLHDEKCLDQKEKTEQLHNEIAHLKKLIISVANEDDTGRNTMTKIYRIGEIISRRIIIIIIN